MFDIPGSRRSSSDVEVVRWLSQVWDTVRRVETDALALMAGFVRSVAANIEGTECPVVVDGRVWAKENHCWKIRKAVVDSAVEGSGPSSVSECRGFVFV